VDVKDYLKRQKRRIGERAKRVRDFSVFDFNHVPEQPLMRAECRELIDAMLRFDASGVPTHLAVVGSRGCGKTLMLKHLQRLIPAQTGANVLYANCRHHSTSYKIFTHLLEEPAAGDSLMPLRAVRREAPGPDGAGARRGGPDEPQGPAAGDPVSDQPQRAAVDGGDAVQQPAAAEAARRRHPLEPAADAAALPRLRRRAAAQDP
jgi:hypothetical protein